MPKEASKEAVLRERHLRHGKGQVGGSGSRNSGEWRGCRAALAWKSLLEEEFLTCLMDTLPTQG